MSTVQLTEKKGLFRFSIKKCLIGGSILIGTILMAKVVSPYLSGKLETDFLATKQHLIHLTHYRVAFYTHIFSSLPVLLSGLFLFSKTIQRHRPGLHRNIGKGYVGLVLLLAAPSGMIMAWYANGGVVAQTSFLTATPLWWWFTWQGLQTARCRNFTDHREWMLRSYAMSFSAITLRASQLVLNEFDLFNPDYRYLLVAWESWLLNLGLVEIYIKMNR